MYHLCASSQRTFEGKRRYEAAISNNMDMGTFSYCGIDKVTRHMFYEVDTNPDVDFSTLPKRNVRAWKSACQLMMCHRLRQSRVLPSPLHMRCRGCYSFLVFLHLCISIPQALRL